MKKIATRRHEEGAQKRKLREEEAAVCAQIDVRKRELADLVASIEDMRKGTTPASDYKKVQREHILVVSRLENQAMRLRDEIATNEKVLIELGSSKAEAVRRRDAVLEEIKRAETYKKALDNELEVVTGVLNEKKQSVLMITTHQNTELARVDAVISSKKEELSQMEQLWTAREAKIQEDERLIAIRRHDLEIYEQRLRKQYPDAVFVLPDLSE